MHITCSVSFFFVVVVCGRPVSCAPVATPSARNICKLQESRVWHWVWVDRLYGGGGQSEQLRAEQVEPRQGWGRRGAQGRWSDTDWREHTPRCLAALGVACALGAVSYAMFFAPPWKVFHVSVLFIPIQSYGCDEHTEDFSTEMSETSIKIDKKFPRPCASECGLGFKKENLCTRQRYLKIILSAGDVKPRGGDIISKHEVTLANQKPEGKWKRNIAKNASTSTTTTTTL